MLIVLAGGTGASAIVRYLLDNHRFVGRNTLPKTAPPKGARVVVLRDYVPRSTRERLTLARRTRKLGGVLVWLDQYIPAMEVSLPVPKALGPESLDDEEERRKNAFGELEHLLALLEPPNRRC